MTKHGISHGAAVVVCFLASELLLDVAKDYVPVLYNTVEMFSEKIINIFNLEYSVEKLNILFYAVVLAVIWGAAFSFMHKDQKA